MTLVKASAREKSILQLAADGHTRELEKIDKKSLMAARCLSGCSALHWAAGGNHVHTVQYLLDIGFDVNLRVEHRKARDRTPLHYACRNGCLEACQYLIEKGAFPDSKAKHRTTPFQLAVWQNNLSIARWLVEECDVDPSQVNDFGCGAVHWMAISPPCRADSTGRGDALLPMARWLSYLKSVNYHLKQAHGHTCLHKAAWMGHVDFCCYLHEEHNFWDDCTDLAGNYAADLADMASQPRNMAVSAYLRSECSQQLITSCSTLGLQVKPFPTERQIKDAYRQMIRRVHPDRTRDGDELTPGIDELQKSYHHLIVDKGKGTQANPAHSLPLMIQMLEGTNLPARGTETIDVCFEARLVAVISEFGEKGLDLSNLRKKWSQVWPKVPFPVARKSQTTLSEYIRAKACNSVVMKPAPKPLNGFRLYIREHIRRPIVSS